VSWLVSELSRKGTRQHRGRLGLVPLERVDHQRVPEASVSNPTVIWGSRRRSLENPGSPNPSAVSVSRCNVLTSNRTRLAGPQVGVRGAHRRRPRRPGRLRVDRQPALQRRIRPGLDPDLLQHPGTVQLAGRLDDPGQYQLPDTS
jgi:hypothetical protein